MTKEVQNNQFINPGGVVCPTPPPKELEAPIKTPKEKAAEERRHIRETADRGPLVEMGRRMEEGYNCRDDRRESVFVAGQAYTRTTRTGKPHTIQMTPDSPVVMDYLD